MVQNLEGIKELASKLLLPGRRNLKSWRENGVKDHGFNCIFGSLASGPSTYIDTCNTSFRQWPAESVLFRGGLLAGLTRRSFVLL